MKVDGQSRKNINEYTSDDFELIYYKYHSSINAEMIP
jgi:thymidylate synthase